MSDHSEYCKWHIDFSGCDCGVQTKKSLALAEIELARRAALEIMRDCPQQVLIEVAQAFDAAEKHINAI